MPLLQFDIPEEIDNELKHYMIDHNHENKGQAVADILIKTLKKGSSHK